jgi:peptidoglycan biosynthesis protein MviN/MurJ (putative lipid II flippase)
MARIRCCVTGGRPGSKVLRNIILFTALVNIGLSLALVKGYGINGIAFAGMISLILWNSCALVYINKKYGRTIRLSSVALT